MEYLGKLCCLQESQQRDFTVTMNNHPDDGINPVVFDTTVNGVRCHEVNWKMFAIFLDHIFFYLFLGVLLLATIIMLDVV